MHKAQDKFCLPPLNYFISSNTKYNIYENKRVFLTKLKSIDKHLFSTDFVQLFKENQINLDNGWIHDTILFYVKQLDESELIYLNDNLLNIKRYIMSNDLPKISSDKPNNTLRNFDRILRVEYKGQPIFTPMTRKQWLSRNNSVGHKTAKEKYKKYTANILRDYLTPINQYNHNLYDDIFSPPIEPHEIMLPPKVRVVTRLIPLSKIMAHETLPLQPTSNENQPQNLGLNYYCCRPIFCISDGLLQNFTHSWNIDLSHVLQTTIIITNYYKDCNTIPTPPSLCYITNTLLNKYTDFIYNHEYLPFIHIPGNSIIMIYKSPI